MAYKPNMLNSRYGQSAHYNLSPCNKEMSARETASHLSVSSLPIKFSYANQTSTSINGDMHRVINPTGNSLIGNSLTGNIKQVQFGIKDPEFYNRDIYSGCNSSFGLGVETCIESGIRVDMPSSLHSSNSPNKKLTYRMPEMSRAESYIYNSNSPNKKLLYRMPEISKANSYIYNTQPQKLNSMGNIYSVMYPDVKASPRHGVEFPNNQMKQYIANTQPIQNNEMKQKIPTDINKNTFIGTFRAHEEMKTSAPLKLKTKRVSEGLQITRNSSKVFNQICAKNSSTFNGELLKHSQSIKKLKYKTKSNKLLTESIYENEFSRHNKNRINENNNNSHNNINDDNVIANRNVSNVQDYRFKHEDNLNEEHELKKNAETKKRYITEELNNLSNKCTEKLGQNLNSPVKGENKNIKTSFKKNSEEAKNVMMSKKEESEKSNIEKNSLLINTKETKTTSQNVKSSSSKKQLPDISLPSINENIIDENGGLTLFEKFIIVDKYDGIKQWNGFEWERIINDYIFFIKVKYDLKGQIWCINDSHEILKIVDGKIKNLGFLGNEKMIDIGFDKNNVLWCVNIKGDLLKWNKTGWRKISYFGFHKLISITFDLEGKLWAINSKKTMAVWNPQKKNWNEKHIKNNVKILHMDFDKNGMIWVLSTTNSLLSYYAGNWINHGLLYPSQIVSFSCKRS